MSTFLYIKCQIDVICGITSIMSFLFPYFTYFIVCNIFRKFNLPTHPHIILFHEGCFETPEQDIFLRKCND